MPRKKKNYRLLQGNEAVAEAAILGGVRFFGGYPITPATEIAEILSDRLPEVGGKFIQMEDEIGSIASIIGASIGGVKAMTSTSGPGFSLMQENLGFACITETPIVIVNVMRGGPSTGLPTSPSQGDVMQARWGTHGDHPIIVLSPSSVKDAFDLTIKAINFSEKYRNPVILLMDEVIAHMRARVALPDPKDIVCVDRIKPNMPPEWYIPFEDNLTGVPSMASFGEGYRYHITGLVHDQKGFPTSKPKEVDDFLTRLFRKIENGFQEICMVKYHYMDDADYAIVAYGSITLSSLSAIEILREKGIKAGLLELKTLWPFPRFAIEKILPSVKSILVPEMNMGQIYREIKRVTSSVEVKKLSKINGNLITPDEIVKAMKGVA